MARDVIPAGRYARGLAGHLANPEAREAVREELIRLAREFESNAGGIRDFLSSPVRPLPEKLALVRDIVTSIGFSGATGDFLAVLVRHGRIGLLPRVAEAFAALADSANGFLTAEVRTARPLDAEQCERLSQALSRVAGVEVRLRQTVDPELLAGASVTVGGRTFDGSVAGGLERLRRRLVFRKV